MIAHPTRPSFMLHSIAHGGKTGRATSGIIRVSERGFWATSNMCVTCRRLPEIPSRRQASTSAGKRHIVRILRRRWVICKVIYSLGGARRQR